MIAAIVDLPRATIAAGLDGDRLLALRADGVRVELDAEERATVRAELEKAARYEAARRRELGGVS